MRILHVITGLDYGGAEKLLFNTCKQQISKGDEVHVIFLKTNGLMKEEFENAGIKVYKYGISGFSIIISFLRLIFFIIINRFDIVHSHLPLAAFMARIAGIFAGHRNLIYTVHNTDRWYTSKRISNRLLRRIDVFLCNLKRSQTIMISNSVRDFVMQYEKGLDSSKIYVIYNAISFDEIDAKISEPADISSMGISSNDFLILTVGRLDDQKGRIVLLKALKILIKDENLTNIKCLVIGGDGNEKEEVVKFIQQYNLEHHVFLLGAQKNPYKYFKYPNLFVMSSIYEGFGIVVLEAYYCRIPVLSSDADGLAEIVKNKSTGITFEKGNCKSLANGIRKFRNNEYNGKLFAANAYEFVKNFNISEYEDKIREIYAINA